MIFRLVVYITPTSNDVDVGHVFRREVHGLGVLLEGHPEDALLGVRPAKPVDANDVHPPALHLIDAPLDQDRNQEAAVLLALQNLFQVHAKQFLIGSGREKSNSNFSKSWSKLILASH